MDAEEFRKRGKELVHYVADYRENIRDRKVLPAVRPGYLHGMIPEHAPEVPERWEDLMADIDRVIMPGVTHWQSPQFHAYYPIPSSYPSICADILSTGIGGIGFSWMASPAITELEVVMMDWLAKMLNLPQEFLWGSKGGGVIQGSASEVILLTMLAARTRVLSEKSVKLKMKGDSEIMGKLVAYCSDQANSAVERAGLLAGVKTHQVESDVNCCMRGDALADAINQDKQRGLIPFYAVATLGTTGSCAFDKLQEIGPVCSKENIWLHVDAAYAGSAFICPEFRPLLDGVEFADSFNFNPHKWMLVNFDCSAMWVKDSSHIVDAFNVEPVFLKHVHQANAVDLRHWQIHLGCRFRSLKLWFVLRLYGVQGIQAHIRKQTALAKEFEALVRADDRFEVTNDVVMGLVCFRLKNNSNEVNVQLLKKINEDARTYLVLSVGKGVYYLRFAVCSAETESKDIALSWDIIKELSNTLLGESKVG